MLDPQNRLESHLNLVIEDGKIAGLTRERPEGAFRSIDAAGQVVCPGFLDIHMHEAPVEDLQDLEHSIFGCMLRMGVTTVLGGNCGESVSTSRRIWIRSPMGYRSIFACWQDMAQPEKLQAFGINMRL